MAHEQFEHLIELQAGHIKKPMCINKIRDRSANSVQFMDRNCLMRGNWLDFGSGQNQDSCCQSFRFFDLMDTSGIFLNARGKPDLSQMHLVEIKVRDNSRTEPNQIGGTK